MPKVRWSAEAERDAGDITDYIKRHNPRAALHLLVDIQGKVALLSDQPRTGRRERKDRRELVVHANYIVLYRENAEEVVVLRVLHAARKRP